MTNTTSTTTHPGTFRYRGHTIEIGHPVKILPSAPGKHDGFEALIKRIHVRDGRIVGIDVREPKTLHLRTLPPRRVQPYLRNVEKKRAALR
jgi:hypothetical protein